MKIVTVELSVDSQWLKTRRIPIVKKTRFKIYSFKSFIFYLKSLNLFIKYQTFFFNRDEKFQDLITFLKGEFCLIQSSEFLRRFILGFFDNKIMKYSLMICFFFRLETFSKYENFPE